MFALIFFTIAFSLIWGAYENQDNVANDLQRVAILLIVLAGTIFFVAGVIMFTLWEIHRNTERARYAHLLLLAKDGDEQSIAALEELAGEDYR